MRVRLEGGPADGQEVDVKAGDWHNVPEKYDVKRRPSSILSNRPVKGGVTIHQYKRDPARPHVFQYVVRSMRGVRREKA